LRDGLDLDAVVAASVYVGGAVETTVSCEHVGGLAETLLVLVECRPDVRLVLGVAVEDAVVCDEAVAAQTYDWTVENELKRVLKNGVEQADSRMTPLEDESRESQEQLRRDGPTTTGTCSGSSLRRRHSNTSTDRESMNR
jgi:hypothetical protein